MKKDSRRKEWRRGRAWEPLQATPVHRDHVPYATFCPFSIRVGQIAYFFDSLTWLDDVTLHVLAMPRHSEQLSSEPVLSKLLI